MVSFLLPCWLSLHLFAFSFWRRRASMVTVLFVFQNTTSVSLRPIFFLLAKSIFQGPTLPLSTHISQSFWCPISRSRHNEQCLLHPNLKVFCVQHPAWIPSNLRWILFFAQDTGVGGFFFFITDHFLSSFLQLSMIWWMVGFLVFDTLVRKSSGYWAITFVQANVDLQKSNANLQ